MPWASCPGPFFSNRSYPQHTVRRRGGTKPLTKLNHAVTPAYRRTWVQNKPQGLLRNCSRNVRTRHSSRGSTCHPGFLSLPIGCAAIGLGARIRTLGGEVLTTLEVRLSRTTAPAVRLVPGYKF